MKLLQEWHLPTESIGKTVKIYDQLESTNTLAASLAHDHSHDGTVILAQEQLAGRGQHGRSWLSPPNTSVLLSVLLFPPVQISRPAILTAWAAVAVCQLVEQITKRVCRIKWPNDVYLEKKKICGILIEQKQGTVVGIGLNVLQSSEHFQKAGLPDATSLAVWTDQCLDNLQIARMLIEQLDVVYADALQSNLHRIENYWQKHITTIGSRVQVEHNHGIVTGQLTQLSFDQIQLCDEDNQSCTWIPEQIIHLTPLSESNATNHV